MSNFSIRIVFFSLAFSFISGPAFSETSEELREQIIQVAKDNIDRTDNRTEVRAELDQLVQRLILVSEPVTEERILRHTTGAWQQIWADERNNDPAGAPRQVLEHIYQYVSGSGWAYNFGVREVQGGPRFTVALGVKASLSGVQQTTEIVSGFNRMSSLQVGESIVQIAETIQDGSNTDFIARDFGRFPRGPIGAKGVLTILYIDQDLKIGTAPNVYTGNSEMFVMERSPNVR